MNAGLLLVALLSWAFATTSGGSSLAGRSLFLLAAVALLLVMRRRLGPALVLIGIMAASMSPELDSLDVGGVAFVLCTSTGLFLWLRNWPGGRWIAASFPFWAMAPRYQWTEFVALGMVFIGMAVTGVGPTLPGRRRRGGDALPHMASGALGPVVARTFPGAHHSRVISVATFVFAMLTVVLGLLASRGFNAELTGALALSSAIIAGTFAFSNWFAGRVQLRIDEQGLHSRLFLREMSIAWKEVAGLSLRYVFLPGMGVRVVYHVVHSPRREFAFPSSMAGAAELQSSIEAATGLEWPEPEITPTF